MRKIYWVLIFIVGFFVVFAVSAVSTFMFTLNRDDGNVEEVTEDVYTGGSILPQGNVIEPETTVTRVTPTLTIDDAIILRGIYYGENENTYEMPSLTKEQEDDKELFEDAVIDEVEENEEAPAPKSEEKEETPKPGKEEVKVPEKADEKAEATPEVEAPKVEEAPEVEEAPAVEEAPKVEEPKVEEKPVVLDPNKQYSDTGI